ncbi:hypothetical protein [Gramella sp. AN32]|uniref:PepSY domain-containing protein n=1 Tax=Christiangramia antarctica TaxID=2058158 RepID=A0ABW5X4C0_9FLAO|nr:hypothetical protein [Gramella sp. AN32]
MKKIVLSVFTIGAMIFATQNAQAQETETEEVEVIEIEVVEVEQDEFADLDVSELPQVIQDAIVTEYNDATVTKAWIKSEDEQTIYKLALDVKGDEKKVFIDQDGNWLENEEKEVETEK